MLKKLIWYVVGFVLCLPFFTSAQMVGLNPTSNIDFSNTSTSGVQAVFGSGMAIPSGYGGIAIAYQLEGLDPASCVTSNNSQSSLNPLKQATGVTSDGILPTFVQPSITNRNGNGGLLVISSAPNNSYFVLSCSNISTSNKYRSIKLVYPNAPGVVPSAQSVRSFDDEHIRLNANKSTSGEVTISWDKSANLQCDSISGYDNQGKFVASIDMQNVTETGSFNVGYLETQTTFTVTCFDRQTLYQMNGLTYVFGGNSRMKSYITVPPSPDPNKPVAPVVVPFVKTFKLLPNNACRTITFTKDLKQGDTNEEVLALEKMIKGGFYALSGLPLSFETPDTYFDSKTTTFISIFQTLGGNFTGDGKVTALERGEFNKLPLCQNGAIGIYPQTTTIYDNAPTQTNTNTTSVNTSTQTNTITSTSRPTQTINTVQPTTTNNTIYSKPQNTVASTTTTYMPNTIVAPSVCKNVKFTSYMTRGSKGKQVLELQTLLKNLGYNVQPNGIYGSATKSAVALYQTDNNISPANGVVGSITRSFLNSKYSMCQ